MRTASDKRADLITDRRVLARGSGRVTSNGFPDHHAGSYEVVCEILRS